MMTPELKKFVEGVKELAKECIDEDKGYVLFAYGKDVEDINSVFSANGKMIYLAECLFSCMKNDDTMASIVIAASNALAQERMKGMLPMAEEAPVAEPKKSKRRKKQN